MFVGLRLIGKMFDVGEKLKLVEIQGKAKCDRLKKRGTGGPECQDEDLERKIRGAGPTAHSIILF